jgi:hypothetical protein
MGKLRILDYATTKKTQTFYRSKYTLLVAVVLAVLFAWLIGGMRIIHGFIGECTPDHNWIIKSDVPGTKFYYHGKLLGETEMVLTPKMVLDLGVYGSSFSPNDLVLSQARDGIVFQVSVNYSDGIMAQVPENIRAEYVGIQTPWGERTRCLSYTVRHFSSSGGGGTKPDQFGVKPIRLSDQKLNVKINKLRYSAANNTANFSVSVSNNTTDTYSFASNPTYFHVTTNLSDTMPLDNMIRLSTPPEKTALPPGGNAEYNFAVPIKLLSGAYWGSVSVGESVSNVVMVEKE